MDDRTKVERAILRKLRKIAPRAHIKVEGDIITICGYNPDRGEFVVEQFQHHITVHDLPAFEADAPVAPLSGKYCRSSFKQ